MTGYPEPEILWEKDGLSIETYPDYLTKFENGLCTLTIEETFTEDSAVFTCRAINSAGSSETSAKVIVKGKFVHLFFFLNILTYFIFLIIFSSIYLFVCINHCFILIEKEREDEVFPPVFVIPLSDVTVKEGEKLEMTCQIAGFPLPTAQWLHKNRCLDADPEFSVTFNNGEAKACKTSAKLSDQGIYTCNASNSHGSQTSTASVTVKSKCRVN